MRILKHSLSLILALVLAISVLAVIPASAEGTGNTGSAAAFQTSYPQITGVKITADGLMPIWSAYSGAAKYRLFIKRNDAWKVVATTTATSYVHTAAKSGTTYTYTVRAMDQDENFISGYNQQGFTFTYMPTPSPVTVKSVNGGVQISWKAVKGAKNYCISIKGQSGWTPLAYTKKTSYTDTNVVSGKTYRYLVRVCSEDNKRILSYYDLTGTTVKYVAAPKITGFAPIEGGTRVSWTNVGAALYRLYIKKSDNTWKWVTDTARTSFDHKGLKDGANYTYTVRAMDKNKNLISGYDTAGTACRYLAPPKISSVSKNGSGMLIKWNAKTGADSYQVYRKAYGGEWKELGKSKTASYTDKTAAANTVYNYTVRCLDKKGRLISLFYNNKKYYANGQLATGYLKAGSSKLYFNKGVIGKGYAKIDGKLYYFNASGKLQKNGLVGTKAEGLRYADKNGVVKTSYTGVVKNSKGYWYVYKGKVDFTIRNGVTSGGKDWNIVDGRAYEVKTKKDRTYHRALKIVAKVTDSSMSKSKKLKAVWKHLKTAYGECSPRSYGNFDKSWVETYANDIFVDKTGDCFSYGAAFAYLAKAVGYTECYACNSGGHGWTEIDGKLYDAEWSMHNSKYTYYGMSYDDPCDVPYKAALALGSDWSHVKV